MGFNLISEKTHKAKKEHICIWCGEKINIDEKYIRLKGVCDDNMQEQCWHLECKKASDKKFEETHNAEFDIYTYQRGSLDKR